MSGEIIDFTRLDEIERELYHNNSFVKPKEPERNQVITCKCGNRFTLHCPLDPKNPIQLLCDDCIQNLPRTDQNYPEKSRQIEQLLEGAIVKDSDDGDYQNEE